MMGTDRKKLQAAAALISGILLLLAAIGCQVVSSQYKDDELFRVLSHPLFVCGFLLLLLSKRLKTVDADTALSQDARPPVIYLRSFRDDASLNRDAKFIWQNYGIIESGEQSLALLFNAVGPFVAIGKPGEKIPVAGAYRMYTGDEEWQEKVKELMENGELIILRAGDSPSWWWEVEQAISLRLPRKLLIYYPQTISMSSKKRSNQYARFRNTINSLLPVPLPENIGRAEFIYFKENWEPVCIEATSNRFWDFVRGWARGSQVMHFRHGLAPFFKIKSWPLPNIAYTLTEYFALSLFLLISIAFAAIFLMLLYHLFTR